MSVPTTSSKNNLNSFASPQSLSEWLKARLPLESLASWGMKPSTKNVHNLWLELTRGETSLTDSTPPVRTVHVVFVRVTGKHGKVLVELHQELSDGNVRKRGWLLSEKMRPNGDPESGAVRGILEELVSVINGGAASESSTVRIDPNLYEMQVEERESDTYPGLQGYYVMHTVSATVEGLPEGDFCSEEVDEYGGDFGDVVEQAVSVKKHYWTWVNADSIHT